MAYTITSPQFSFVRFSDELLPITDWRKKQIPGAQLGEFLPVNAPSDLAFQVLIETGTKSEADTICGIPTTQGGLILAMGGSLPPVLSQSDITAILGKPGNIAMNNADLGTGRFRVSDTQILYYFPRIPNLGATPYGSCFQIVFTLSAQTNYGPSGASNVFIYNGTDTDFTSVLNYFSARNEADFIYCADSRIKNRVRLPLYLTRPTFPDEEETLRLSSNDVVIRKSIIRKLYEVVTDSLSDWMIEGLRAVFLHDEVYIGDAPELPQTMPYKGEIVKEGAYEPRYVEYKNYPKAPITLKVNAVDFSMKKNNCGICVPISGGLIAANGTVGMATPNSIYNVDLIPLTGGCCKPVQYAVDYYQANYIASINISQTATTATLNIGTKSSLTQNPSYPPPFAVVRVTCGNETKYINITGGLP